MRQSNTPSWPLGTQFSRCTGSNWYALSKAWRWPSSIYRPKRLPGYVCILVPIVRWQRPENGDALPMNAFSETFPDCLDSCMVSHLHMVCFCQESCCIHGRTSFYLQVGTLPWASHTIRSTHLWVRLCFRLLHVFTHSHRLLMSRYSTLLSVYPCVTLIQASQPTPCKWNEKVADLGLEPRSSWRLVYLEWRLGAMRICICVYHFTNLPTSGRGRTCTYKPRHGSRVLSLLNYSPRGYQLHILNAGPHGFVSDVQAPHA